MIEYQKFDEAKWLAFGKRLLPTVAKLNLSSEQVEFLEACRDGQAAFLDYLDTHFLYEKGAVVGQKVVPFRYKFSENEFFLISTKDTQKIIWDGFKAVDEETKFSCGFWGYIIVEMLKNGAIEKPSDLASTKNMTGHAHIDDALAGTPKNVDDCVRRILRSMCNSKARGHRIIFYDFPLGRTYWRWHWAHKMAGYEMPVDELSAHGLSIHDKSADINLDFAQVLAALDMSNYRVFAEKMHTGRSFISAPNILGGLLLFLAHSDKSNKVNNIGIIIDRLAYLSSWKAIELQSPADNQLEIEAIADNLAAHPPTKQPIKPATEQSAAGSTRP